MKIIGIIGGMGPSATVDLFQKVIELTPAERDQDHCHLLIDNYPQIPDRTAFLLGTGDDPFPFLLESARRLEKAGAEALCMPCNTAHYFIEDLRMKVRLPFISIIDSTVERIKTVFPMARKIGLLATRGTTESGIYHRALTAAGLETLQTDESFKQDVMDVIYTVKAGRPEEAVGLFNDCVRRLQAAGADVLIAGCTEIPLLLPHLDRSVNFVDPTLTLAEKIVAFARG